jgi:hypothetical protein
MSMSSDKICIAKPHTNHIEVIVLEGFFRDVYHNVEGGPSKNLQK